MILDPIALNSSLSFSNRIVMAPMTRAMSYEDGTPTEDMIPYYAKRAEAGLIITEGTIISEKARGYRHVPGLFSQSHINAWRKITDAVHNNGGKIFCQLWHVGRVSHPQFLKGERPISPSQTKMTGPVRRETGLYYGESKEASVQEIQDITSAFTRAADYAMQAGFDGIELHGANGYLIDQFLHHSTNLRTDEFGGTPQKMAHFLLNLLSHLKQVISLERVGIRLSPVGYLNQVTPSPKDKTVFIYLLQQLNHMEIAYIHTGAFDDNITYPELDNQTMSNFIRQHSQQPLIACGSYDLAKAENGLKNHQFDMIALGRPFLSNPFLIETIKAGKIWQPYDVSMLETLN